MRRMMLIEGLGMDLFQEACLSTEMLSLGHCSLAIHESN